MGKQTIRGIGIQNFKTFSSYQYCDFSDLSFLIGKNGVGKSSFLQAAQLLFKFIEKANPSWDEIIDEDHKVIKIERVIGSNFFEDFNDFTSISQIINDYDQPLIIDVLVDFSFKHSTVILSTLRFNFCFDIQNEQELFLSHFRVYEHFENEVIFENDVRNWNQTFGIEIPKNGLDFLLDMFIKYINTEESYKKKFDEIRYSKTKQRLKSEFLPFEEKFLSEIDSIKFNYATQEYRDLEGDQYTVIVHLFNGGINYHLRGASEELKKVLNITYQELKETFIDTARHLSKLKVVKVSDIAFRRRTLERTAPYLKNFINNEANEEFIESNLSRFNFKGLPRAQRISEHDTKYRIVMKLGDGKLVNLVDEGSGYWTLAYLIRLLANKSSENKLILIEEPEIYLHPHFQANLADMFIQAVSMFGQQIVVETHSEYLIKRLQRRVAQSIMRNRVESNVIVEQDTIPYDVQPGELIINYIHDNSAAQRVTSIRVDNNGNLDAQFPPDFTDVSIREDLLSFRLKNLN